MKPVLSLQNVSKAYAGKYAVKEVSFDVGQGEIIGFLGPNGAGKTTSLRMALGLIKPDTGRVSLFGRAPGPHNFGRIGFLPEERGLYKKQTAREAVAHMAQLNGMKRAEAFKRADDMLLRYGLGDARRKKNKDMSKGMAQKVQLLAAIAHNPEFYILDEPFSGLDPVNQQVLEGIVREIAAQGHTILFSTHVMEHAERLCDRIILMSQGEKCFDGTTEAALAQAPRRLVIGSKDIGLTEMVTPFVKLVEAQEGGVLNVVMKDAVDTQDILVKAVDQDIKLTRFEPQRASLHEAFVALVGETAAPDISSPDISSQESGS
jgi:ABC-2 type transport system ATP-binding protein